MRTKVISLCIAAVLLAACNRGPQLTAEELAALEKSKPFKLQSLRGTRDGDKLLAVAMFSDSSAMLNVVMQFTVGSPTTLKSGTWTRSGDNQLVTGTVTARSVTFLGGQDGPPSIGGTFDLLDGDQKAAYRVTIPVTELKSRQ